MTTRTYADKCLREGRVARWPDKTMPIQVYIAPFRWYEKSKQRESTAYVGLVMETLDKWSQVSGGLVRFQLVGNLNQSQIDVRWRRVDRKSLGHCEFNINEQSVIYSAEVNIGISDGVIHARYNDLDEVRHTILHEFGHALGLTGHSDHPDDIMYVPHQYGVTQLSARDIETLQLLYALPTGFDYMAIGRQYKLPEPFTFHDVVDHIQGRTRQPATPQQVLPSAQPLKEQPEVLDRQHGILSEMGRFHLATQDIRVPPDLRQRFLSPQKKPPK